MSEEQKIPADVRNPNLKTKTGVEHFPEDSHAPKPLNDINQSMEVHKHPHHMMHKKRWFEYLLEFLMLFLAVFLGFIAENYREHYIEHKREKKFAVQLLSDLRKDSAFFSARKQIIEKTFAKSWMIELFKEKKHPTDAEIADNFLKVFWHFTALLTNTTFTQMKTSGSLRYVRNLTLTTELQNYYDVLAASVNTGTDEATTFLRNYMLPWYVKHIKTQDIDSTTNTVSNSNSTIIDRTQKTDQEVINITNTYRLIVLGIQETWYIPAAAQADTLIGMLKREYHLK